MRPSNCTSTFTADNQLVVSHDTTTGRFTDRYLVIAESTYEELAALDAAHSFREETRSDRGGSPTGSHATAE